MALFALAWILAAGVYVLLEGEFSAEELVAGVLVGLCAALWALGIRRNATVRLALSPAAAKALARAAAGLPLACVRVAGAFAAAVAGRRRGRIVAEDFDTGRQDEAANVGRRAVALLAASLAPDSYVVRMDKEAHRLRSHVILARPAASDPRWGR